MIHILVLLTIYRGLCTFTTTCIINCWRLTLSYRRALFNGTRHHGIYTKGNSAGLRNYFRVINLSSKAQRLLRQQTPVMSVDQAYEFIVRRFYTDANGYLDPEQQLDLGSMKAGLTKLFESHQQLRMFNKYDWSHYINLFQTVYWNGTNYLPSNDYPLFIRGLYSLLISIM